jgi:hypothetical protein
MKSLVVLFIFLIGLSSSSECSSNEISKLLRINPASNSTAGMMAVESCTNSCRNDGNQACLSNCVTNQLGIAYSCGECFSNGYTTCAMYCISDSRLAVARCKYCSDNNYKYVAKACNINPELE